MSDEAPANDIGKEHSGTDVSISMGRANLIAIGLLIPIGALTIVPHWLLHGAASLGEGFRAAASPLVGLPAFILSIIVHEGLHGFGYRYFGKVSKSDVKFGINWKALSPYAHCKTAMTAKAYRISVVLPGLLLGVVPVLAGIVTGIGWLTVWGFVMTAAAGGDITILWTIRNVESTRFVQDHPTRAGCVVM